MFLSTNTAAVKLEKNSVKVERGSAFMFTRDLLYIASILFTRVRNRKLRDIGTDPPLVNDIRKLISVKSAN